MEKFKHFSKKQLMVFSWWCANSKYCDYDAIICDGAVRSGKTVCMSLSFILWAFAYFDNCNFALCGKTVTALKRNVVTPLIENLRSFGFVIEQKTSQNFLVLTYKNRSNRFYLFSGKDEGSAALIQGMTLAGIMLDEVALMPRSFVEQALARCSVAGSKFWFNCNPEHPFHWFYQEWIQKAEQKKAVYLHFDMRDNPSLSKKMRRRYASLYTGAFYERFVLGKWSAQNGQVYPMFHPDKHVIDKLPDHFCSYYISCDYGITNPASFGLWGKSGEQWIRICEYYFDSKREKTHKTDEEYYQELCTLAGNRKIEAVIVDPSATSFIECIRRHNRFHIQPANNDVMGGINLVSNALTQRKILFHSSCKDTIREFYLYCWDENKRIDSVKKENDHAMDDVRYFVNTVFRDNNDPFFVLAAARK